MNAPRILFDLGHPAHVHLFRNLIPRLRDLGWETVTVSRRKDLTAPLLDHYGIEHAPLSSQGKTLPGLFAEMFRRSAAIYRLHRDKPFDAACGTSVSIGHLTLLSGTPSYNFNEDDDDVVPLYALLAYPFSSTVINPSCLRFKRWKKKRILYSSYHELAYLHPGNFQPDPAIPAKYGLTPGEYAVARHSALSAHHDRGAAGLSKKLWDRVLEALQGLPLVLSREGERSHQIDPWDMHHVLAFARLCASDSQTMTAEAAVLGVPALRYNSFVGKIGYLEELEHVYNLTLGFRPGRENDFLAALKRLLDDDGAKARWRANRERMLSEKLDFNEWMFDFFTARLGERC